MATKNKFPERGRTEDGTEVRLCPLEKTDGKPLYCSRDGVFYSRRMVKGVTQFRRIVVNRTPPRDIHVYVTRAIPTCGSMVPLCVTRLWH